MFVCPPSSPADPGPAKSDRHPLSLPDHLSLELLCALATRGQGRHLSLFLSRALGQEDQLAFPSVATACGPERNGQAAGQLDGEFVSGPVPSLPPAGGPRTKAGNPVAHGSAWQGCLVLWPMGAGRRKALIRLIQIWGPRPALSPNFPGALAQAGLAPPPRSLLHPGRLGSALSEAGPAPCRPAPSAQIWAPSCPGGQTSLPHLSLSGGWPRPRLPVWLPLPGLGPRAAPEESGLKPSLLPPEE